MKKKNVWLAWIVCAGILYMFVPTAAACAANDSGVFMDVETEQAILQEFEAEIRFVEEQHGIVIESINDDSLEAVKQEAVTHLENPSFRFAELMDKIAVACAQGKIASENTGIAPYTERPIKQNEVITVYKSFGPLKGKYINDAPVGSTSTISGTANIQIGTGEVVQNVAISGGGSVTLSYSLNGPADNTVLPNGVRATHRVAMGVLYGTILKHEYDWYFPDTGYIHRGNISYTVESGSATPESYTFLASIGVPTYAAKARGSGTLSFSDLRQFRSQVESNPDSFI